MKKIITLTLCVILTLGMFGTTVSAADAIKVVVDGKQLQLDVVPIIVDGRALVPMRTIFEALGASVNWNQSAQTVIATKENTVIKLQINNSIATVNGNNITLDVPARLVDGRTLVPLRFVGESLNCDVNWNGNTRTITIISSNMTYYPNTSYRTLSDVTDASFNLKVG